MKIIHKWLILRMALVLALSFTACPDETPGEEEPVTPPAVDYARAPAITEQPQWASCYLGGTVSPLTAKFLLAANTGTLSAQWYVNDSYSTSGGTAIEGATNLTLSGTTNYTSTYTPDISTAASGRYYYYVVVTNYNENATIEKYSSLTSSVAVVAVVDPDEVEVPIPGLAAPYNISINLAQDSSTGFVALWHNASSAATQKLQFVPATGEFAGGAEITVTGAPFEVSGIIGTKPLRNVFKVHVSGLLPNTKYKYRMGDSGSWSETHYYTTSGGPVKDFSFTVIADPQGNSTSFFRRMQETFTAANTFDDDNRFFIVCGDLTDIIGRPNEIELYASTAGEFHLNQPIAATQGNHDTMDNRDPATWEHTFDEATIYNEYIASPDNGWKPSDPTKSNSYYFYYNDILFIMLNTMVQEQSRRAAQVEWLRGILETNKTQRLSKYIIVSSHFGPFGNYYHERTDIRTTRETYGKLFSDYEVDIYFQGHDHTYARTNPVKIGADTAFGSLNFDAVPGGTVYCIAGSTGPKFNDERAGDGYGVEDIDAIFVKRTRTIAELDPCSNTYSCNLTPLCGMFVNVKVTAGSLIVTARKNNGETIDEFEVPAKR